MAGVERGLARALRGAGFVELPTYAFDRRRFWLSGEGVGADAAGLGLGASEHALLSAVVELPASGGVVLTGRLSPSLQGGWPITRWPGWWCFRARGLWSWRSAPATKSAARWSTS